MHGGSKIHALLCGALLIHQDYMPRGLLLKTLFSNQVSIATPFFRIYIVYLPIVESRNTAPGPFIWFFVNKHVRWITPLPGGGGEYILLPPIWGGGGGVQVEG